jgi:hypothetical protein
MGTRMGRASLQRLGILGQVWHALRRDEGSEDLG